MRIKTLFPVLKRITEDMNVDCFDWLIFWLHGPGEYVFSRFGVDRMCKRADYSVNKSWNVRFSESFSYLFGTLTRSAVKEIHNTLFAGIVHGLTVPGKIRERGQRARWESWLTYAYNYIYGSMALPWDQHHLARLRKLMCSVWFKRK